MKSVNRGVLGLMLVVLAGVSFSLSAEAAVTVSGEVVNAITAEGVSDVYLEISAQIGTKYLGNAFSSADGSYSMTFNPGTATVFTITCFKSGYLPATVQNVTAGSGKDVMLNPVGISYPERPRAISSPKSLYVEWTANPEHNLAGYYLYRYPCNADGSNRGAEVAVNNGELITSNQYADSAGLIAGQYYTYRVKAKNTGGRVSEFSEYSEPRKGRFLTIFLPDINYSPSFAGLYLWEQTDGSADWLRIPISSDCAYNLSTSAMQIVAELPTDLLDIETISQIKVLPTGITSNMTYNAFVPSPGVLKIAGIATEGVQLYGSGSLFDVWVHPKNVTGYGDLLLKRDGGQFDPGVRIYEYLTEADRTNPLDYERRLVFPDEYELWDGSLDTQSACRHGDVNGDEEITQADVDLAMEIGVGVNVWPNDPQCYPKAADINNDDYVDQADAVQIKRWLKGRQEGRGPEYFNPNRNAKNVDLDSLSFAQTSAKAVSTVSLGEIKGLRNTEVEVPLTFVAGGDYSPMAGFSALIGFVKGPFGAYFVSARLGESLVGDYSLICGEGNPAAGQDATSGCVRLAASSATSLGEKGSVVLVYLKFRIGSMAPEYRPVSASVNSFLASDPFGQTPKFDTPGQPVIERPCARGDVNQDGVVDEEDVQTILQIVAGTYEIVDEECILQAGDLNSDGRVDQADAAILVHELNQVEGVPPEGQPVDGQPVDGEPVDGEPVDGEPVDGEPVDGEPADGEPVDGEPADGEPVDGEPADGEPADGEPADGEPADGEREGGRVDTEGQVVTPTVNVNCFSN